MKNADEIKKGLQCCKDYQDCNQRGIPRCSYYEMIDCMSALCGDAIAYIQQLESKLNQAVEDIRMLGRTGEFICPVCAHYNHGEGTKGECVKCLTGDGFRWRGSHDEHSLD